MRSRSPFLFLVLSVMMTIAYADALDDGMTAFEAFEYKKAEKLLRPLATQGEAVAQVAVGIMYASGLGELKRDSTEALQWFLTAAEQGNVEAGFFLGELYGTAQPGLQINHAEAVKWYRWAAEQGHINAQYKLGSRYFKGGEGLPMDYVAAFAWMDVAARQGHYSAPESCNMIAMILNPEELAKAKALADDLAEKYIAKETRDERFKQFYQISVKK